MPTGSCIPANPYLVTIFGPAGSGKSALANAVAETLGPQVAARVPTDYFFLPKDPAETLDAYLAKPLAWDWALLRQRLALPIGTDTTTPDADFDGFARIADTGGRPMPIRPVMLIDAMAPFPGAHVVVRVDVPESIRCQRIIERDERWGTRVRDRWSHLEATWSAVPPSPADVLLDGTRSLPENAALLVSIIGERGGWDRQGGR